MRGTKKRIVMGESEGEEVGTEIMSAALLAHSNAISVLPVPLLYIWNPASHLKSMHLLLQADVLSDEMGTLV